MTLATDMSVFPEELTALEGWGEYITDFDESEYEPLWGYAEQSNDVVVNMINAIGSLGTVPEAEDYLDLSRIDVVNAKRLTIEG